MGVSRLYIASYGSPIPSSEMYTARAFLIIWIRLKMFLLQLTEPYNTVETGSEDWIIPLIFFGILAFYILLCVLVGRYAKKHSRSFWGFFILSLILSPFWGIIIAIIVGGETEKQRETRIRREVEIRMQVEDQYRQQYNQTPPHISEN